MLRAMSLATVAVAISVLSLVSSCSGDSGLKVTRIDPKEGPYQGGDPVSIHGNGFEKTRPANIYFNGRPGRILSVENDRIIVEPPGGNLGEKVTIKIIFDDSRAKEFKDIYTYIEPNKGFGVDELTGGEKKDEKK